MRFKRTRPQQRIKQALAVAGAVFLFAAGFALASPDLTVGVEALFVGSDSATIVYTANEPADFTCQLGETSSPCGTRTTKGSVTYPVTAGSYTFSVIAQNTTVNKEEHRIDTVAQTATTSFTVAGETAPAPPPPPVAPPPPPPVGSTQPDLAIALIGHRQGANVRATVEVTNIGSGRAGATNAHLRVAGVTSRPRRVPALGPGHHYRLRLVLPVPSSVPGHRAKLFAVVSPVPGETQVENNIDSQPATFPAAVTPPPAPDDGTTWWPFAAGAAALLLIGGAVGFLLRGRVPATEKLDWQLQASDGELPQQCHAGQRICKREGELNPAFRRLLELTCAQEPASGHELAITGDAIRRLTDAHSAYATNQPDEAVTLVAGAEAQIWEQVSAWLGHGGRGGVHLDAKFEGSSASCTFKLFRCAPVERPSLVSRARHLLGFDRDDEGPWRELAHWKAEVKDTATVEVGTLDEALVWDGTRRADLDDTLRAHLGRLAEEWVAGG